jgi:hypothetical protein
MSENQNSETSPSSGKNNEDYMETNMQTSKELVDKMSMEKNEPRTTSGMIFQELLYKFQQLQKNNADYQNCLRQEISLCSELIDTVEKSTPADDNDFHSCFEYVLVTISTYHLETKTIMMIR